MLLFFGIHFSLTVDEESSMSIKRNAITRDAVIKANMALIEGRTIDFSKMPSSVANIIQKNKPSSSDIRRAFTEARREVETDCEKFLLNDR
jgi:hypothetical protein